VRRRSCAFRPFTIFDTGLSVLSAADCVGSSWRCSGDAVRDAAVDRIQGIIVRAEVSSGPPCPRRSAIPLPLGVTGCSGHRAWLDGGRRCARRASSQQSQYRVRYLGISSSSWSWSSSSARAKGSVRRPFAADRSHQRVMRRIRHLGFGGRRPLSVFGSADWARNFGG